MTTGAGQPFAASGRIYEAALALRDRRPRAALFHSALQVNLDGTTQARAVLDLVPCCPTPT